MAFVPLFCQSHHSREGVASPSDLVRRARKVGCGTLGLCDEASFAGHHAFNESCRERGIRPIFGCRLMMKGLVRDERAFPMDFLIESEQGYRNLTRLLTFHHNGGRGTRRLLAASDLRERLDGLVTVVAPDGELAALVAEHDRPATELFLRLMLDLAGDGLALGVSAPDTDDNAREAAQLIQQLARFLGVPATAAPRIRYPEPGDAAAHLFLTHPGEAPGRSYTPPKDLRSLDALWPEDRTLARWPDDLAELVHESSRIARRCAWRPGHTRRAFPSVDLERGFDPSSYLFDLVIRGATRQYGEMTEELKRRIHREYEDVKIKGLAPSLLLAEQIARMLDEQGVSRGVGRGRMVSSTLAYCLGITRLDPMGYRLAWKGLTNEGEVNPAIRIEIPRSAVPRLIEWLGETFGEDHLAEIGRVQMCRRDQMIGDLANWAGMTDEEKQLVHQGRARLRSAGAAQRLGEMTENARSRRWRDPAFLGDLAARLAPRPRQWVAGGDRFVLCGEPLESVVPLVPTHQGRPATGIEEVALDRMGLARLIFVSHHLLDILDQAFALARSLNPRLDPTRIPFDDRAAWELIAQGDTTGIPPLEGPTVRCLLRRDRPANLMQLLRVRNEAQHGPHAEGVMDLGEELPDVVLSYQIAWLKVHCPQAFYGAALGAEIAQRHDPSVVVRETRRAGFDILAPHINWSQWDTTIHAGNIRLGLSAVHGLGRRAWEEIRSVRDGGHFTSLAEFCKRVETRLIPISLIRSLIASGAMDGLGPHRAGMDALVTTLQREARRREPDADGLVQETLFDMDEIEPSPPDGAASGEGGEWNPWERTEREAEALGFFLSADPLRRWEQVLGHLRPSGVEEISTRMVGRRVRVAGLVGRVEIDQALLGEEGDALMDIEGLPTLLPARLAATAESCLSPGAQILATGRLERSDGFVCLQAEGIWRLEDLERQAARVGRVRLGLADENHETLKMLLAVARAHPGSTEIELTDFPTREGWTGRRLARTRVFFCSPLYQAFTRILPPDRIELFDASDAPLAVHAAQSEATDAAVPEDA